MDLASLCGKEHLAWLYADVHAFDAAEAEVAAWTVQHDCAATVDHVGLEKHFVDVAVIVDDVQLGWG